MTLEQKLNLWLNLAVLLCIVGVAAFISCLGSTTWYGDDE